MAEYAGIDISKWQYPVDYDALKNGRILGNKIKFVMIRISYGTSLDIHALEHIRGCLKAGLYVGLYLYSIAKNAAQARAEAEWLLATIKANKLDGKISYPIAYDLEEEWQIKLGKTVCTAMCKAFMDVIAAANYQPMLYTNVNWICCHLNYDQLRSYPLWLAAYISEDKIRNKYGINNQVMWQHSVAGHRYYDTLRVGAVPGVIGQCDCNVAYEGLAANIRKAGRNKLKADEKIRITAAKTVSRNEFSDTCRALASDGFTIIDSEVIK
ncbi:MAG: hypothetical protein J6A16_00335 [Oscillospiraceae bacterium]|nr:hypothetical protein [Oscillospiraceae bacterium]